MARATRKPVVLGLDQLDRRFQKLIEAVSREEQIRALTAGGQVIADEGKRLAPKLSGDLADSIHVREATRKIEGDLPAVVIGPKLGKDGIFYAHFQEYGTSKMAAHPYMRPAVENKQAEALEEVANHLRQVIEEGSR